MPAATTIEITAAYLTVLPHTKRDNWAVHRARIIGNPTDDRLRDGMEIEITGESEPAVIEPDAHGIGEIVRPAELQRNREYRFYGRVVTKNFRGKDKTQFAFTTFVAAVPHSPAAVQLYLQQCPHIGQRTAAKLFTNFGPDAVRILRESPDVVAACSDIRLTLPQAREAAAYLAELAAVESCTLETMGVLDGFGLPKATAKAAIKKWGNRAATIIKANPYQLMRFRGCGFLKADKIYQSLSLPLGRLKRQTLSAWYYLKSDANGHTWHEWSAVEKAVKKTVGSVHRIDVARAVAVGERAGLLATYTDERGGRWVAEGVKAREEEKLANLIVTAMDEENPWSAVVNSPAFDEACAPLTNHQRAGLRKALAGGAVAILGGGPGAGKTFTAAALMRALVAVYGEAAIAATAFTGKAAARFNEGMQVYGLPVRAKTTHSLLKLSITGDDDSGDAEEVNTATLQAGAADTLPGVRVIVVDEVSMDDVPLLAEIAAARSKNSAVLIIGDVKQLPPIGHGAPLRDLITAGLPYGELTEIRRNAGTVVRFCKKLREKQPIDVADFVNQVAALNPSADDPANLRLITAHTPDAAIAAMLAAVRDARDRFGFDPVWETQVVVARNTVGELSRVPLNEVLQREFNGDASPVPGCKFRVGSKAIQLKNMSYDRAERGGDGFGDDDNTFTRRADDQAKVFNGEFCRIVDIDEKRIVAAFENPNRMVWIPQRGLRGGGETSAQGTEANSDRPASPGGTTAGGASATDKEPAAAFDLGYAATCHKMQGSQEKHIVVVLDKNAYGLSLEWLLTAVSRCEKLCTVIGDISTIRKIAAKSSLMERKTFLVERIEEKRIWSQRCWWLPEAAQFNVTEELTANGPT
jgi:exodeoxyribonuclease V alpha subunit